MRIEEAIIDSLYHSEHYARTIGPFIKPEYFAVNEERHVVEVALKHFEKYNKVCDPSIAKIELSKNTSIGDEELQTTFAILDEAVGKEYDAAWLRDETEAYCKRRAIYNALYKSVKVVEGKDNSVSVDGIDKLLAEAISVSFDREVGHDYFEDMEARYGFYHNEDERLKFDIEILNAITNGGLSSKTLTCFLAGTGVGKSMLMCHLAAHWLSEGKNVLYITMEMAEEKIAERIDANRFNIPIQDIKNIPKDKFLEKVQRIKSKTSGRLIIKEYPTGGAHAGHFRALMHELKIKKDFIPDVVFVDYLNICASQRVKNTQANSYTIVKSIAEEIRGLAMEFDIPILTATQVVRGGLDSSDLDMSDTSESIGLAYTLDLYLALIGTEELSELNQVMFKQLKNRYNDTSYYRRFVVGVDKAKMKFYNLEKEAQDNIVDAGKKPEKNKSFNNSMDNDVPVYDRGRSNRSSFEMG